MKAMSFTDRLRAWRLARGFTFAEAVAELGRYDLGRPAIQLSEWSLEHFEKGLKPLPEEQSALESILARGDLLTPDTLHAAWLSVGVSSPEEI